MRITRYFKFNNLTDKQKASIDIEFSKRLLPIVPTIEKDEVLLPFLDNLTAYVHELLGDQTDPRQLYDFKDTIAKLLKTLSPTESLQEILEREVGVYADISFDKVNHTITLDNIDGDVFDKDNHVMVACQYKIKSVGDTLLGLYPIVDYLTNQKQELPYHMIKEAVTYCILNYDSDDPLVYFIPDYSIKNSDEIIEEHDRNLPNPYFSMYSRAELGKHSVKVTIAPLYMKLLRNYYL